MLLERLAGSIRDLSRRPFCPHPEGLTPWAIQGCGSRTAGAEAGIMESSAGGALAAG